MVERVKNWLVENKAVIIFFIILLTLGLLYVLGFHSLLEYLYHNGTIEHINKAIGFTHKSLEHYCFLFDKMFFCLAALAFFILLLYRLVFSPRQSSAIWPVFLGVIALAGIYILNPNNRVYSFHGFYHAGIVYQILNGNIPPDHPLLAGQPLLYPWGYHLLAAGFSKLLNVTPFTSFALINIISLVLVMLSSYHISRLLIQDRKVQILAMLIPLCGTIILNSWITIPCANELHISMKYVKSPVFNKFLNSNGMPLGLALFFGYLYAVIQVFLNKKPGLHWLILFFAFIGCGFFYPLILPPVILGTLSIIFVLTIKNRKKYFKNYIKKDIFILIVLIVSMLIVSPYLLEISAQGKISGNYTFSLLNIAGKIIGSVLLSLPLLIIIFINRKYWKYHINPLVFTILLMSSISSYLIYLLTNLLYGAEYKYLYVTLTTLGFAGAISLAVMDKWCSRKIIFALLLLFLFPAQRISYRILNKYPNLPIGYVERGTCLYSQDIEQEEFYEWIRTSTPVDSVFVDTELTIPVYAQRQLLIGLDKKPDQSKTHLLGYHYPVDMLLREMSLYDTSLLDMRLSLVNQFYNPRQEFPFSDIIRIICYDQQVYIVIRNNSRSLKISKAKLKKVFESSKGNYIIYSLLD